MHIWLSDWSNGAVVQFSAGTLACNYNASCLHDA